MRLWPVVLLLVGCGEPSIDPRVEALEQRVTELEEQLQRVEARTHVAEEPADPLKVVLPSAGVGTAVEEAVRPPPRRVILELRGEQIQHADKVLTPKQLTALLTRARSTHDNPAVLIRHDGDDVSFASLVDLLDTIKRVGIEQIAVASLSSQDTQSPLPEE